MNVELSENTRDEPKKIMTNTKYTVDEIYEVIGLGTLSVICTLIFSVPLMLQCAIILGPVFQLRVPEKYCLDDQCTVNMTDKERCDIPRTSWAWNSTKRTLISQFDLLCQQNYAYLASSLFFMPGMVIGLSIGGFLQDRFGRKLTNIAWTVLMAVACLGEVLSPIFSVYLFFRVLGGVSIGANMSGTYIWLIEFFSERKRPIGAVIHHLSFESGPLLLPLLDYYTKSSVSIDTTFAVLSITSVFLFCLLPESPHWLTANGRDDEARDVLQKMARLNRCNIPIKDVEFVTVKKHKESGNILHLITNRSMSIVLAGLIYEWFIISVIYYGVYFAITHLSGSFHLNSMLIAVSAFPFAFFVCYFVSTYGRRKALMGYLGGVAVYCLLCLIKLDLGHGWNTRRIIALIGSRAIGGQLFYIIYLQTSEVLPTSLRTSGTNICSVSARLGAFVAPYVIGESVKLSDWLYFVFFAVISVIGIVIAWFLPETKGKTLKSTLT